MSETASISCLPILNGNNNVTTSTPSTSTQSKKNKRVEVTVLTGYMGAGKTTIILHLLRQMRHINPHYKIAWLKNEYGINEIDTLVAKEINTLYNTNPTNPSSTSSSSPSSSLNGVKELTNGCICCTLVGQLEAGILELIQLYNANRILIETSGSALPMTLSLELQRIVEKHSNMLHLDLIVCVIDCVNFSLYGEISYTAKLQAKYTDLILLNKSQLCNTQQYDRVLDYIYELNPHTPKIKPEENGYIDYNLVFTSGIEEDPEMMDYNALVNKHTLSEDDKQRHRHSHTHHIHPVDTNNHPTTPHEHTHDTCNNPSCTSSHHHMSHEVNLINWSSPAGSVVYKRSILERWLKEIEGDVYYRVKGVIWLHENDDDDVNSESESVSVVVKHENGYEKEAKGTPYILNYAFGRYEIIPLTHAIPHTSSSSSSSSSDDTASTSNTTSTAHSSHLYPTGITIMLAKNVSVEWYIEQIREGLHIPEDHHDIQIVELKQ